MKFEQIFEISTIIVHKTMLVLVHVLYAHV